MYKFIYSFAH